MTTIKAKLPQTSNAKLTATGLQPRAGANPTVRTPRFDGDALDRTARNRMIVDSMNVPAFGAVPGFETFKVNDLLNGAVPSFGRELDRPGKGIATGLDVPNQISEPTLGEAALGMTGMGYSQQAVSGQPGTTEAVQKWVTAASLGVGAAAWAVGAVAVGKVAAAFGAGYALGEAIDTQIQHSTGTSLGEALYDALHSENTEPPAGSRESSDAGTATAGAEEDQEGEGTQPTQNESGDAGVGESAVGDDHTADAGESSDAGAGESSDAGANESPETASSAEQAESQRDPELPQRYRPSYAEIASSFGATGVGTHARSNPNPAAEDREELGAQPSLGGRIDRRLVNEEGRAEAVGTAEQFGLSVLATLGTVRPSDEGAGGDLPESPRFGGVDPAA